MGAPRERMLRLLSLLQSGRRWSSAGLAAAMDATPRTLRRDIEHLREMGYPVESARGPGGHYRPVAGAALPPLMLEDDEAVAVVLGLRLAAAGGAGLDFQAEAADRAVAKLRRVLPAPLRRRADEIRTAVDVGAAGHPQPGTEVFRALASAITAEREIVFDHSRDGRSSPRTAEPYRLVRVRRRWYLFAWDLDRRDWRSFRLDRIGAPRATGLARPVGSAARSTPAHRVILTLHTDARDAATRLHRVDGTLQPLGEHSCRYTARVDSYEWLVTVLVLAGIEFTVEEPGAFAAYLAEAAHRLLRAAGPPA